jgi:hypothetical protein
MFTADKPLVELVEELPPEARVMVRDFVEFLLSKREYQSASATTQETDEATKFPVDPRRPAMLREVEAYHRLHPELLVKYRGKFVAIHQGQLLDHDPDPVALLKRTSAGWPNQVVLIRKVESTPETTLVMRSPRLLSL